MRKWNLSKAEWAYIDNVVKSSPNREVVFDADLVKSAHAALPGRSGAAILSLFSRSARRLNGRLINGVLFRRIGQTAHIGPTRAAFTTQEDQDILLGLQGKKWVTKEVIKEIQQKMPKRTGGSILSRVRKLVGKHDINIQYRDFEGCSMLPALVIPARGGSSEDTETRPPIMHVLDLFEEVIGQKSPEPKTSHPVIEAMVAGIDRYINELMGKADSELSDLRCQVIALQETVRSQAGTFQDLRVRNDKAEGKIRDLQGVVRDRETGNNVFFARIKAFREAQRVNLEGLLALAQKLCRENRELTDKCETAEIKILFLQDEKLKYLEELKALKDVRSAVEQYSRGFVGKIS